MRRKGKDKKTEFLIMRITQDEKTLLKKESKKNFRTMSRHIRILLGLYKPKVII